MRCPHCKTDIRQAMILAWAGTIVAKRRRRAGNTITSDEARAMQAKSAAARRANAARNAVAGSR